MNLATVFLWGVGIGITLTLLGIVVVLLNWSKGDDDDIADQIKILHEGPGVVINGELQGRPNRSLNRHDPMTRGEFDTQAAMQAWLRKRHMDDWLEQEIRYLQDHPGEAYNPASKATDEL